MAHYCPDCEHFISCCLDKQIYYKATGECCEEFEEAKSKTMEINDEGTEKLE